MEGDTSKSVSICRVCRESDEWWLLRVAPEESPSSSSAAVFPSFYSGWRVYLQELTASREWIRQEHAKYINTLELRTVLNALTAFQDRGIDLWWLTSSSKLKVKRLTLYRARPVFEIVFFRVWCGSPWYFFFFFFFPNGREAHRSKSGPSIL